MIGTSAEGTGPSRCDAYVMPDPHKLPKASLRPTPEAKQAAKDALAGTDWTLNDFVTACMLMLAKRPKTLLRELEPFKPPRKRGRPPGADTRKPATPEGSGPQ